MAKTTYNIIYTSPADKIYLWNGRSVDLLGSKGREMLKYSGPSVDDDAVEDAILKCRNVVNVLFPKDENPDIRSVPVSI